MDDVLNGPIPDDPMGGEGQESPEEAARMERDAEWLEQAKRWFQESETGLWTSRKASQRDRDFVDGKQWTKAEEDALAKRGQGAIVFNRIRGKVSTLIGVEQKMRSDPKAWPRTPHHDEEADTATDALRYVCDNNQFDQIASRVWDEACCVEGVAGVEMTLRPRPGRNPEIVAEFYPYDRCGWDPHSRDPAFEDTRYKCTVTWMDGDQAKKRWPQSADMVEGAYSATTTTDDTYEDTPRFWADRIRRRVQVIRMWWREGPEWMVGTFVFGGWLEAPTVSPWLDEDGRSMCGLILCSGYVTREGERYGATRAWIGPQEDINKRRSKALHLLSTRQTVSDPGVFNDVRKVRNELAKPDGHIQKDAEGDFAILPTGDMAAGQMELLREAKAEIDQSASASVVATPTESASMSGVALQSMQGAGMLELSPLLDNHKAWKLAVYRAMWAMIRQFWSAPQWLRVTDNPESLRWVGINQPVTVGQQMQAAQVPIPPGMQADPRLQLIAAVQNQPAQMDVDLVIDDAPDAVTTSAQELELLVNLKRIDPMSIPTAAIIRASELRGKQQLLEALEGTPETREQMQAEKQQRDALALRGETAQIARTEADAAQKAAAARKNLADAAATMRSTPSEIERNEAQADKYTAEAAAEASQLGNVLPFGG